MKNVDIDMGAAMGLGSVLLAGVLGAIFKRRGIVLSNEYKDSGTKIYIGPKNSDK